VLGKSNSGGDGVLGQGRNGVHGQSASASDSGVWGENTGGGTGVAGSTSSAGPTSPGNYTANIIAAVGGDQHGSGYGVRGLSAGGLGVYGKGIEGVYGEGTDGAGVKGVSKIDFGVSGDAPTAGVIGHGPHVGVHGYSK
jgi:hypothetical protein